MWNGLCCTSTVWIMPYMAVYYGKCQIHQGWLVVHVPNTSQLQSACNLLILGCTTETALVHNPYFHNDHNIPDSRSQHLPGSMNSMADIESRAHPDRSGWKLAPLIFQKIHQLLGLLSVNIFASHLSAQLPLYVSWKPDPLAMGTGAFSMNWTTLPGKIYANPPWGLIGRVLSTAQSQRVQEMVLVAPVWKAQAWYPLLLQMLVREPLIIPHSQETIQSECLNNLPDIIPQLAVWVISGVCVQAATFRSQLQTSCYPPGEINQQSLTTHPLEGGLAGVMSGTKIPVLAL